MGSFYLTQLIVQILEPTFELMKKIYLLVAIATFILCSCSQKEDLSFPESDVQQATLNLDRFTFSETSKLLKGISKSQSVEIIESGQSRIVTLLPSTFKDGNEIYFNGAETDSISFILSPEYVSLSMQSKGRELKYVDYANSAKMAEVVDLYNKEYNDVPKSEMKAMTRSGNVGLKLDMSELEKNGPELNDKECKIETVETPQYTTRSTPYAINREVTIRLFREKGSHTFPHEVGWAKENLIASIKAIVPDIKLIFITEDCGFEGGNDADAELNNFYCWRFSSSEPHAGAQTDIFVLMRWGWYNKLCDGISYLNTYNINHADNHRAVALCSVQPLSFKTMAHEVGHILGANHPSKMYFSSDLMSYSIFRSNKHKDKNNIQKIKENLTPR